MDGMMGRMVIDLSFSPLMRMLESSVKSHVSFWNTKFGFMRL